MLRLLSIELDKIKRNKAAKVITLVYGSLILGISLIASYEFDFAGINFRKAFYVRPPNKAFASGKSIPAVNRT